MRRFARDCSFQRYIVREVYRAFATLAGPPEQESREIEDLGRLSTAIEELASRQEHWRQGAIETSRDLARQAWRDLRAEIRAIASRVVAVEQRVGGVIQAWEATKAARAAPE